ncbi:hypothetical protein Q3C01_03395 [Bradyrhizobium sp. UFLA05-109]
MLFISGGGTSGCCAADETNRPPRITTQVIAIQRDRWAALLVLPRMVK